jgi:hypothetical protein
MALVSPAFWQWFRISLHHHNGLSFSGIIAVALVFSSMAGIAYNIVLD